MIARYFNQLTILFLVLVLSLVIGIEPVFATTFSFKTEGIAKRDGLLTGQLVFTNSALQAAIRDMPSQQGTTTPIPLSKIEGAEFSMRYVSPYSGVKHTEATLCGKEVYDINGFEEEPLAGSAEPVLVLSSIGQPEFIDFNSCVGQAGSISPEISQLDPRVIFSTVDSLFGKLSVFDKDLMGNMLYKKIQTIKFTLKP